MAGSWVVIAPQCKVQVDQGKNESATKGLMLEMVHRLCKMRRREREKSSMICSPWLTFVWIAGAVIEIGKMSGGLGLGIKPLISFQTFECGVPVKYAGGDAGSSFGIN